MLLCSYFEPSWGYAGKVQYIAHLSYVRPSARHLLCRMNLFFTACPRSNSSKYKRRILEPLTFSTTIRHTASNPIYRNFLFRSSPVYVLHFQLPMSFRLTCCAFRHLHFSKSQASSLSQGRGNGYVRELTKLGQKSLHFHALHLSPCLKWPCQLPRVGPSAVSSLKHSRQFTSLIEGISRDWLPFLLQKQGLPFHYRQLVEGKERWAINGFTECLWSPETIV